MLKSQMEIIGKEKIEIKSLLDEINRRVEIAEDEISELDERSIESTQS